MNKKQPTIKDVARLAGVSVATVSNVLNGIPKYSLETKEKTLKAIKILDYHPDFNARTLSNKKSYLIGVILPIIADGGLLQDNPFYSDLISSVEYNVRHSEYKNYDILMTGFQDIDSCIRWIRQRNLDGVIILGIYPDELFIELSALNIPLVIVDSPEKLITENIYNVELDDEYGGYIATKYLIRKGHKKIAIATGNLDISSVNQNRKKGYEKALKENKIDINPDLLFEESVSFNGGYKIGEKILNSKEEITAIFSTSDIKAFGIMNRIKKEGKSIPNDYSIIGFDNLSICKYIYPGLTTVSQNIFYKGKIVVETLIESIQNNKKPTKNIILPLEIIERDSVKELD